MNDFYIGYLPKAPTALAGFVRKVIVGLGLVAVTLALVLVFGQMPFANSAFEYGKVRTFEGIVEARPFPTLLVARPGKIAQQDKYSRYLLVAPGKHGADDLVAGFDGKQVASARPVDLSRGWNDGGNRTELDRSGEMPRSILRRRRATWGL